MSSKPKHDVHGRLAGYVAALEQISQEQPSPPRANPPHTFGRGHDAWDIRYKALRDRPLSARLVWLDWVEERARAGTPEWCVELVSRAVTLRIAGDD